MDTDGPDVDVSTLKAGSTTDPGTDDAAHLAAGHPHRRPQLSWIVVGVLLVCGSALAFGVVAQQLSRRAAVVTLARPLERGHVVGPADLAVARVAADPGVPLVPAGRAPDLVGRALAVDLPAGALLTADLLGPADLEIGPESRTVGLSLAPGEYPVPTLAPGDAVTVVDTAGAGTVVADDARVLDSGPEAEGAATLLVSVVVDVDDAARIAAAAAQGNVRLVLHGRGGGP